MAARGQVGHGQERHQHEATVTSNKKKTLNPQGASQNEDFDFWSMPQNDYGKKKKDFVQDSNLWVNQKEQESPFITENSNSRVKKKRWSYVCLNYNIWGIWSIGGQFWRRFHLNDNTALVSHD